MMDLVSMTESEFEEFMKISMRDHAQSQVKAGNWNPGEADKNIETMRTQFLPNGLETTGHHFFTIRESDVIAQVGGLWFMVGDADGARQLFVLDIQIFDNHRRRGYGTHAFALMEEKAKSMGVSTIALHVFKHNAPARAMYAKLGYEGIGEEMSKKI